MFGPAQMAQRNSLISFEMVLLVSLSSEVGPCWTYCCAWSYCTSHSYPRIPLHLPSYLARKHNPVSFPSSVHPHVACLGRIMDHGHHFLPKNFGDDQVVLSFFPNVYYLDLQLLPPLNLNLINPSSSMNSLYLHLRNPASSCLCSLSIMMCCNNSSD